MKSLILGLPVSQIDHACAHDAKDEPPPPPRPQDFLAPAPGADSPQVSPYRGAVPDAAIHRHALVFGDHGSRGGPAGPDVGPRALLCAANGRLDG